MIKFNNLLKKKTDTASTQTEQEQKKINRKKLAIWLCAFLGPFALLGLCWCKTKEEKKEYISGWKPTFCIVCGIYALLALILILTSPFNFLNSSVFAEAMGLSFFVKALLVGSLVSLCSALLGVSLVLKKYSMIGDGLSHVGFGSLAIAMALNWAPLALSIPVVTIAAFLLLRISESSKIKGDSAIALISTASLAIGVLVISVTSGMSTDVCNYMFGSILVLSQSDVIISVILSVVVIVLYILFYSKIFAVTFDENFARATGTKSGIYNTLIAILTAITIVIGMRLMGSLLISSLIVFPALTSMRLFKNFKSVVICSAILSVFCFITGIFLSYIFDTAVGALVVCVNLLFFLTFWGIGLIVKREKA